jgi:hypothetical protein
MHKNIFFIYAHYEFGYMIFNLDVPRNLTFKIECLPKDEEMPCIPLKSPEYSVILRFGSR